MAGIGGDVGRRLRPRSGAPSSVTARSTTCLRQTEASKKARPPPKRAANDDNSRIASVLPPQAKKRAALANLTNVSSCRNTLLPSKPQVSVQEKLRTRSAASQVKKIIGSQLIPSQKAVKDHTLAAYNDENAAPSTRPFCFQDVSKVTVVKREIVKTTSVQNMHDERREFEGKPQVVVKPAPLSVECNERRTINIGTQPNNDRRLLNVGTQQAVLRKQPKREEHSEVYEEGEGWSCWNYVDIDTNKDPQMCSSYAADIYFYLRVAELKRRPSTGFMETLQQDINCNMRSILVDWLVEVAEEYKLVPDTLYLTVSYIDRFLSLNVVNRQCLQLLGVASMLIASKYEEICAPQVDEFCYITDNTYSREEVLQMEKTVLNQLNFELTGPTTKTFLRRFVRAAQAGQKVTTLQLDFLGNFLAELTLLEYGFLKYLPSMIAAAAVFLAKLTLDPTENPWNSTLEHYSGYKASDLKDCVKAIHGLQCNKKNCTLPAVREKYKQPKFKSVANLVPLAVIPLKYFEDTDAAEV